MIRSIFILTLITSFFFACDTPVYTPKPRAYPRIELPKQSYNTFNESYCKFKFEKPVYTSIEQDTLFFDTKPLDPCWFDLVYPQFNGRIHFSYTQINKRTSLNTLINDAYDLANKHNIKAEYIDDYLFEKKEHKVYGAILEIGGPVASPFQFYLTDSTQHYVRGALYFNTQPNPDSMAPVIGFVKTDIIHALNTLEWQE